MTGDPAARHPNQMADSIATALASRSGNGLPPNRHLGSWRGISAQDGTAVRGSFAVAIFHVDICAAKLRASMPTYLPPGGVGGLGWWLLLDSIASGSHDRHCRHLPCEAKILQVWDAAGTYRQVDVLGRGNQWRQTPYEDADGMGGMEDAIVPRSPRGSSSCKQMPFMASVPRERQHVPSSATSRVATPLRRPFRSESAADHHSHPKPGPRSKELYMSPAHHNTAPRLGAAEQANQGVNPIRDWGLEGHPSWMPETLMFDPAPYTAGIGADFHLCASNDARCIDLGDKTRAPAGPRSPQLTPSTKMATPSSVTRGTAAFHPTIPRSRVV